jgi:hypothetical protein
MKMFLKNIDGASLLLDDSWTEHKDPDKMKNVLPNKNIDALLVS